MKSKRDKILGKELSVDKEKLSSHDAVDDAAVLVIFS